MAAIFLHFGLTLSRDKTMADKLMYIPNDDTQNNPFGLWTKWNNQLKFNQSPQSCKSNE